MKLLETWSYSVVLIGGATGLIGDPKETEERKLLTLEESLKMLSPLKIKLNIFYRKQFMLIIMIGLKISI